MTKKSTGKTQRNTLDSKHQAQLRQFEKAPDKMKTLSKKKKSLENEFQKLSNLDYSEVNQQVIDRKATVLEEIKSIEKEINRLDSNIDEVMYYNDTIDYLESYYDEKKEEKKKVIKINELSNFFKRSHKDKSEYKKSQLFKNYMVATENIQKRVSKKTKFKPRFCKNKECKNKELILHLKEGYLVCTNCGQCEEILLDSDKPNYKDPVPDSSAYAYKRINHLNEWLAQFQAKESTDIPDYIYEKILVEIKKENLINKTIKPIKMKEILKKLGFSRYYEHVPHIINKVTGAPPPKVTREVEEKLRDMFRRMQDPFVLFCPKERKNFLNYAYTLHKCCELLELDDFLPCFPLLKSPQKLREQDMIWKKICNYLNWEFISSI